MKYLIPMVALLMVASFFIIQELQKSEVGKGAAASLLAPYYLLAGAPGPHILYKVGRETAKEMRKEA